MILLLVIILMDIVVLVGLAMSSPWAALVHGLRCIFSYRALFRLRGIQEEKSVAAGLRNDVLCVASLANLILIVLDRTLHR